MCFKSDKNSAAGFEYFAYTKKHYYECSGCGVKVFDLQFTP